MSLMILPVVLWSGLAAASPRIRAARAGPDLSRILWVGAHPDDEALIAPLLGKACVNGTSSCAMLVMTRGENGVCGIAGGCFPDLGSVREMEMRFAATLLDSRLTQWSFADVMERVETVWAGAAGGHDALVNRIVDVIESEEPTVVVTFDPNHGSSCHPAHAVTGALVAEAIARISDPHPLWFVETFYTVDGSGFVFRNAVTTSQTMTTFEAAATWYFLVRDALTHASQFTLEQADALDRLPPEQKRVYLMPAGASGSAQYNAICP